MKITSTLLAFVALSTFVFAQTSGPSVSLVSAPMIAIPRGKPGTVPLQFRVNSGYHVNSNTPKAEFLIPTVLKMNAATDIVIGKITYPPGKEMAFDFSPDEKLSVYTGDFAIDVLVRPLHTVLPSKYVLRGNLRYQACNNRACYPPKNLPVEFEVHVTKGASTGSVHPNRQSPHVHK